MGGDDLEVTDTLVVDQLLVEQADRIFDKLQVGGVEFSEGLLILPLHHHLRFRLQRFQAQINAGHLGPGTYTIPSKARAAVIKRLNTIEGVEFLTAQRDATAPESGAHVFLAAIGTVPSGLEDMVKADVQTVMGKDSPVRVIILQSAAGAPLEAADPEDREPSISARPRA